ncbi:MAG: DUF1016 N-terminal domain-containing protein [Bacteroidales bacterium]|jgi:hypothetical protein|nr:DUF1016 N-terminal domain-containing protein [Bacteroidales bacterium]
MEIRAIKEQLGILTETNLKYMRQFYRFFDKSHALRDELSWTHYRLLLKVESEQARQFFIYRKT